jgi:ABC-type lipoprotein export system ATPase subunit
MGTPLAGNYCPPGSISPTLMCPSGHYCPNVSSVPILCPENYYCKVGTVDPRPCSTVAKCQVGSSAPGIYVNAIVGVVILLFVLWILYLLIYVIIMAKRRKVARQRENRERVAILIQPLLNPNAQYNAKVAHLKLFRNIQPLISIKFTQLGLTLKDGSSILSGVTGEFQHSKLYAVMGPSGAGKSTFFNALTGSASSYGSIKGTVEINGKEANLNQYKDVLGFVPQDDTVHEDLTVMENLLSSVKIRSARGTTAKECKAMVDAVIDLLGMSHISQSIVGSVEHRGISGGQRKRVNIGTELVAKPSVCFMDEVRSLWGSSAEIALTPP